MPKPFFRARGLKGYEVSCKVHRLPEEDHLYNVNFTNDNTCTIVGGDASYDHDETFVKRRASTLDDQKHKIVKVLVRSGWTGAYHHILRSDDLATR